VTRAVGVEDRPVVRRFDLSAVLKTTGGPYVAVRLDGHGRAVQAAGPFFSEAEAAAHVAGRFGGRGHPVPLLLVFRRL
jgi:hypothetical protein